MVIEKALGTSWRVPNVYGTVSFMKGKPHTAVSAVSSRFAGIGKLGCPVSAVVGRSASREAAICLAVVELLSETSYESVTMDAVAARAKASKATIYRRWSNKEDLVVDALSRIFNVRAEPMPATGNLRDDLIARINQQIQDPVLFAANTAAMKSLVHAAAHDGKLADVIRTSLADAQLHCWQTLLDRAHRSGELAGPVDAALVWEVAQGQFCARTSVESGLVDAGYVRHVVDDVLMPVVTHASARALPAPG